MRPCVAAGSRKWRGLCGGQGPGGEGTDLLSGNGTPFLPNGMIAVAELWRGLHSSGGLPGAQRPGPGRAWCAESVR